MTGARLRTVIGLLVANVVGTGAASADEQLLARPNPLLTPGAVRADIGLAEVCGTKWGADARHVTEAMKSEVFRAYGLIGEDDAACDSPMPKRRCEVDHLIPRDLGGADATANLWPEPYYAEPWNATLKDRLEARLKREVCAGRLSLREAEQGMARDWIATYLRYYPVPAAAVGAFNGP
jgi:hypothetical protein